MPREPMTLEIGVENKTFLLEGFAHDVGPLQYLRELTKNSMEAICRRQRSGGLKRKGRIEINLDSWEWANGYRKLAFVDNGDGMTPEQLLRHMGNLSSSGGEQGLDKNFGIGAKISTILANPFGVIYQSWVGGRGHMVRLWRDPVSNRIGLMPLGTQGMHVVPIIGDIMPELIQESGGTGTKVILMGTSQEDNTTLAPPDNTTKGFWIQKELNSRFYDIPGDLELSVCEGMESVKASSTQRLATHYVYGTKSFLEKWAVAHGEMRVTDATLRWWILPPANAAKSDTPRFVTKGFTAALFQGELHERTNGKTAYTVIQGFGISAGYDRVVIIVQPDEGKVRAESRRAQLRLNGKDLPWGDWSTEFDYHKPKEIRDLIVASMSGSNQEEEDKSCREALKDNLHLFKPVTAAIKPKNAKPSPKDVLVDPKEATIGAGKEPGGGGNRPPRGDRPTTCGTGGGKGGTHGNKGAYSQFIIEGEGVPATLIESDIMPNVQWREPVDSNDPLEGRAVVYNKTGHIALANSKYPLFEDMAKHLFASSKDKSPEVYAKCVEEVQKKYKLHIMEVIVGILEQFRQAPGDWSPDNRSVALSPEALTTAVQARIRIFHSLRQTLSVKGIRMDKDNGFHSNGSHSNGSSTSAFASDN